jgi:hypothetical protein
MLWSTSVPGLLGHMRSLFSQQLLRILFPQTLFQNDPEPLFRGQNSLFFSNNFLVDLFFGGCTVHLLSLKSFYDPSRPYGHDRKDSWDRFVPINLKEEWRMPHPDGIDFSRDCFSRPSLTRKIVKIYFVSGCSGAGCGFARNNDWRRTAS